MLPGFFLCFRDGGLSGPYSFRRILWKFEQGDHGGPFLTQAVEIIDGIFFTEAEYIPVIIRKITAEADIIDVVGVTVLGKITKERLDHFLVPYPVDPGDHRSSFQQGILPVEVTGDHHGVVPDLHAERKRGKAPVGCPAVVSAAHAKAGMSAPDLIGEGSEDLPAELLFGHAVADGSIILVEIIIQAVFRRIPIRRRVFLFEDVAQNGIIFLQLCTGIFFFRAVVHPAAGAGKKRKTETGRKEQEKNSYVHAAEKSKVKFRGRY